MDELKNLKISKELHKEIKIYCVTNDLKINEWVNKQLWVSLKKLKKINENKMD